MSSNRELDRRCAEILGWTEVQEYYETESSLIKLKGYKPVLSHVLTLEEVPQFESSLDDSRELLEWVHDPKDEELLSNAIAKRVLDPKFEIEQFDIVRILRATPRQIAEAFVETFGENK